MTYRECKQCGNLEHDCDCRNPDVREHHSNGEEVDSDKNRSEWEKPNGGFLSSGFKYVPGDPFW